MAAPSPQPAPLLGGVASGPRGDPRWCAAAADVATIFDHGVCGFYCSAEAPQLPIEITYCLPRPASVCAHTMSAPFVGCLPQCDTPSDYDVDGSADGVTWHRLDEIRGAQWSGQHGETQGRALPGGPSPPPGRGGLRLVRWRLLHCGGRPDGTRVVAIGRLCVYGVWDDGIGPQCSPDYPLCRSGSSSEGPPTPLMGAPLLPREPSTRSLLSTAVPECPVCLEELDGGGFPGSVRTLQCGDRFHAACIEGWAQRGNSDCPVCRAKSIL
eukprot:TRINITY_DN48132_c0_g1_i1.p1 TRINITY_DN48132_c0_g1~~TRINITY_DN48132_c0_g1_i1.p1  ORF type:complete len:292 (+),score=41.72 TRINITY_DN48132_c0_g1_i1:74-877(+)